MKTSSTWKTHFGDQAYASFYQWMKGAYGINDERREVYTFNPAPFIANENWGMQGYLSSEPYMVAKEAGWEPDVFLIADAGYSTLIETMADTVASKPEQVTCFVEGSIKGWYNYLYNDNTAPNEMIKKDNPDITDEVVAYTIEKMNWAGSWIRAIPRRWGSAR